MASVVTIITYHYVRDLERSQHPRIKGLSTVRFISQLDYLQRHYQLVTMAECLEALDGGASLPPGAALLTFDDGYVDHFTNVFPVLSARGIEGSFFPAAAPVQEPRVLDVNKIHFVLASVPDTDQLLVRVFGLLDEVKDEYALESKEVYFERLATESRWDSKEIKFVKNLLQHGLPVPARNHILAMLFRHYVTEDEASFADELYMSEDQIRNLRRHGMHVGSHGYSHARLDELTESELQTELKRSEAFLTSIGVPPDEWTLCYPHGSYNEAVVAGIRRESRFRVALSLRPGIAKLHDANAFHLERIDTNDLPFDADASANSWTRKAMGD